MNDLLASAERKAGAREPKTYETELDLPGPVVGWNEGWPRAGTPRARKSTRPSHLALTRAEPTPRATTTPKRRRKWERTDRAFHGADSISNINLASAFEYAYESELKKKVLTLFWVCFSIVLDVSGGF